MLESRADDSGRLTPPGSNTSSSRLRRVVLVSVALAGVAAIILAVVAPLLVANPNEINLGRRLLPPSSDAWFGTDELGRDLFARVAHGTRLSLLGAAFIVVAALAIGLSIGVLAGYIGGRFEDWTMRFTDLVMAFPYLILGMAIAAILGPSMTNAVLSLTVVWWPSYARLARGQVLVIKAQPFIAACDALGMSRRRIILRHLLPHCWAPVQTKVLVDFSFALIAIASLSFVGMGAQPPQAELGSMIFDATRFVFSAWWYGFFPGAAMFMAAVAANVGGDLLQDRLEGRL